jgi:hypothetical protein
VCCDSMSSTFCCSIIHVSAGQKRYIRQPLFRYKHFDALSMDGKSEFT